jgi:maltooligosyltrehalose trehalohydrolase
LGRPVYGIAESDLNTLFFLRPPERGGCGLDAQWTDDFHHALHSLLTGERSGYYADFGGLDPMAKAMAGGFVYTGQPSAYRRRRHGVPADEIAAWRHVVCVQNHDQIGNRLLGERIASLVSFESLKLAAGALLLSPFLPLLFMGEEWGETAPFLYFVDHSDEDLRRAVRDGRREEFAAFTWQGEAPDPDSPEAFERSRIDPFLRERRPNRALYDLYRELIRLRKTVPALAKGNKRDVEVTALEASSTLLVRRRAGESEALMVLHFGEASLAALPVPAGRWRGPGGAIPEEVDSPGELAVPVAGRSVVLLAR